MTATTERYAQTLARLDRFATLTDARFTIPFTRIRFGLDPLIGLIPGIGDVLGLLLSLYVLIEAVRLGVPRALLMKMLANVGIEFVGGIVPVVGDVFDLYWKANIRNTALLREYIGQQLAPPPAQNVAGRTLGIVLLGVLAIALCVALLRWPVSVKLGGWW